ncbi:protein of unknown function [Candidatus Nitrospira inopinata]|uniref:Uncharacterized protein n=1 Tax=Candidatus Nitrospira inopinata TaxID=1715989 RepID=A0A0S4KKP0_9BACT|nr:protein of unknown function [Candidatus Nitrospira inopinata]
MSLQRAAIFCEGTFTIAHSHCIAASIPR